MVWAIIATFMIVVFAAMLVWVVTADPLVSIGNSFSDMGSSGGRFDLPALVDTFIGSYFSMFLILIFGLILWGAWRILRRELTRTGGGGL